MSYFKQAHYVKILILQKKKKKIILESSLELKKETTQNKIINDTFYTNLLKTIFE